MARPVTVVLALVSLLMGGELLAQTPTPQQPAQPAAAQQEAVETRPATTTFLGDTGLWFVPSAEILPDRRWSLSGYRANWDYEQGFTDVSHFAVTFGVGLADRVELFGSWRPVTRIARKKRVPLFTPDQPKPGGVVNEYPFVTEGWTGNVVGDLYVGAKLNVLSEFREAPVAFALRGTVKLPTGDQDGGGSTGATDFLIDAILSKEIAEVVDLSGFAGFTFRGSPDEFELSSGFRAGIGAAFPSRSPFRLFTELRG
jgi:hypothetical protein